MDRLSSNATFFHKRIVPVLWFGFLILFIVVPLVVGLSSGRYPQPPLFIIPVVLLIFGFVLMRKLVFDLVDEVLDGGDVLIVRNRGKEDRIALADIKNVNYSRMVNPPRVTLALRRASKFGSEVTFCPRFRVLAFPFSATNPRINDLIDRIDAARRSR
jgi:hypothetical protein